MKTFVRLFLGLVMNAVPDEGVVAPGRRRLADGEDQTAIKRSPQEPEIKKTA